MLLRSLILALVIVLLPISSQADQMVISDENDSRGFLDIRATGASHGHDGRLKHTITTFEPWRSRKLGQCASFGLIFPQQDRDIAIFWRKGSLHARLVDRRTTDAKVLGHPRVWRRDRRTVTISIRRSKLGVRGLDSYRWRAVSGAPPDRCPDPGVTDYGINVDRAPDQTHAVHNL